MKRANIGHPDFTWDETDPKGFRAGSARLGSMLGAKETGITVYELPPGQAVCPYHYECGEEEWLLVLSGTPTLRTPEGEERLAPWDVACFPRGPEGAHGIKGRGKELYETALADLPDAGSMSKIAVEVAARGVPQEDVDKIFGGSYLAMLERAKGK